MENDIDPARKSLHPLFPHISDEELGGVEDCFYCYLEIAWRIFERLEAEGYVFSVGLRSQIPTAGTSQNRTNQQVSLHYSFTYHRLLLQYFAYPAYASRYAV